ncbi:hypothetical protein UP10_07015 [Bradyrhizobium sp. LTSPM299]|uniref:hypothetical protein n=1 Tax=Bradyrhizobium sp. LTSPM299 TaxID=1619233 RepID=UPI0005CB4E76|nr:hypothetical protein [Bradyrhizobium sp. LTSPM299]KJC61608.1 hypothetical protein UP10_07015 [Bradyrhizobium sp. LTSPM299]
MQDERNNMAALNNAEWCAAVWRSHRLPVEQAHGMWFCPCPTPQYYPNVVTVDAAADPVKQTGFIAELARGDDLDFSVKDSFSCLDLSAAGLHMLFDARWLCLRQSTPAVVTGGLGWRRIGDEPGLAVWERAWRGAEPDARRIFRAELLEDRRVCVLAGFDDMGKILAGGIAYDAAGAIGVTNIFGSTRQFLNAVATQFAPSEIVCYEHGRDLTLAMDLGFTLLGGLRVWARIA